MRALIVILGPTATGKSALGVEVAAWFDGEVVSADALQAYRRLDCGTAKPSPAERARVEHHLVDILDPREPYSAGEFSRLARRSIRSIRSRGRAPILVGGSGFYLRALLEGLSPVPEISAETRANLRLELERSGLEPLLRELRSVDPESANRISEGDTQRVLRALEVWRGTSRPLSWWLGMRPVGSREQVLKVGLTLPRSLLYDRIAQRVRMMFQQGWVEEVRGLLAEGFTGDEPGFQAIGYREIVDHLATGRPQPEVMEDIIRSTRRYAKRQLTWFRREPDVEWYPAENPEHAAESVIGDLERALNATGEK